MAKPFFFLKFRIRRIYKVHVFFLILTYFSVKLYKNLMLFKNIERSERTEGTLVHCLIWWLEICSALCSSNGSFLQL